jgi:hypothetical protein
MSGSIFNPIDFTSEDKVTSKRPRKEKVKKTLKKQKKAPKIVCPIEQKDIQVTSINDTISFNDVKKWKTKLEKDGYAVVTGLCTKNDINEMLQHWEIDLVNLGTGIKLDEPGTFKKSFLPGIASVGIFKDPASGFGQSRSAWESRRLALPLFKALYETDDIQSSFDTGSLFPNWSLTELKDSRTMSGWLHIDKGKLIKEDCVQGMFTWLDASESTGSLVVCPGTHKLSNKVLEIQGKNSNYIPLDWSKPEIVKIVKDAGVHLVRATAGAMILWNSATIHANNPALVKPTTKNPVLRYANYVCMLPSRRDQATLDFRSNAVDNGQSCNHWPFVYDPTDQNSPNYKKKTLKGPKLKNHLVYPRHKSHRPLKSVALSSKEIREKYGYML